MKLRVEVASPFIVVGLYGLLVFGIIVPVLEGVHGISADFAGGRTLAQEAEMKVGQSWRELERCIDAHPAHLGVFGRTIVLRLGVAASGVVVGWETVESPSRADRLSDCLINITRTWRFSRSDQKERIVDVTFDPARQMYDPSNMESSPF